MKSCAVSESTVWLALDNPIIKYLLADCSVGSNSQSRHHAVSDVEVKSYTKASFVRSFFTVTVVSLFATLITPASFFVQGSVDISTSTVGAVLLCRSGSP